MYNILNREYRRYGCFTQIGDRTAGGLFQTDCEDLLILPAKKINALLVNVPDHGANERKIKKAQKMFELAQPQYFMLDSGGFQLLKAQEKSKKISFDPDLPLKHTSREINISSKHVMESAVAFQPCIPDIVVGLDFPIDKRIKEPKEQDKEFNKKLNQSQKT